jgi:hypothetical protein
MMTCKVQLRNACSPGDPSIRKEFHDSKHNDNMIRILILDDERSSVQHPVNPDQEEYAIRT